MGPSTSAVDRMWQRARLILSDGFVELSCTGKNILYMNTQTHLFVWFMEKLEQLERDIASDALRRMVAGMTTGETFKCNNLLTTCRQPTPGILTVSVPGVPVPFPILCRVPWKRLSSGEAICCADGHDDRCLSAQQW